MLGFVGVGVIGEPVCRNLARKSGERICAYDLDDAPLERLGEAGVIAAESVADVARRADVVFLALPGRTAVGRVCVGAGGLLAHMRPGGCVVDLGTSSARLARELAERFGARGIEFCDAPVARDREAAERGTLLAIVGATVKAFHRVRPLLEHVASDIVHCGPPGSGQTLKAVSNMVLFENVVAIAEALAIVRASGIRPEVAVDVLARDFSDSVALRRYGLGSIVPGRHPRGGFPTLYALKDIRYALELAREAGLELGGAANARVVLKRAAAAGFGDEHFTALAKVIGRRGS
jgi:3-hydroxyisobutyrate dehydrogenase-like beta-hydroxyacid dehydrogenase